MIVPPVGEQSPSSGIRGRVIALSAVGLVVIVSLGALIAWRQGNKPHPTAPHSDVIASVSRAIINIDGVVAGGYVAGTGMILDSNGTALTNNHVVADTTSLTAQVDGVGRTYDATVLGVDPTHDVALIRLTGASGLPIVTVDASQNVSIGDHVTGLGNAFGQDGHPVSAPGTITSLDQTIGVSDESGDIRETLNGVIEFSGNIQPGDSGGPLVDSVGHVIGMDTAGSKTNGTIPNGNAAFAIPIKQAIDVVHQIESGVASPYIQSGHRGIVGVDVVNAPGTSGAVVSTVTVGSPAASAGIHKGDVITAVDGITINSSADFTAAMRSRRPGSTVTLSWSDASRTPHVAPLILDSGPPE